MNRWIGKVAIVTGASSGIGEAIAKALVEQGVNVMGLARREEKLKELENKLKNYRGKFYFMKCDVKNEKDIFEAFAFVEKQFHGVDILINNAGIVRALPIKDSSTQDFRDVLEINTLAATICTREALKSLHKSNKEGHIININSVLGRNAKGHVEYSFGMYAASKFAMRAMTETLRLEIANEKAPIRLTSVHPGYVRTEILGSIDEFQPKIGNKPVLESEHVADSILHIISAPPIVQIEELVITPLHNLM